MIIKLNEVLNQNTLEPEKRVFESLVAFLTVKLKATFDLGITFSGDQKGET